MQLSMQADIIIRALMAEMLMAAMAEMPMAVTLATTNVAQIVTNST